MAEVDHDAVIPLPRFHEAAKRLADKTTTRTPDVLLDDDKQSVSTTRNEIVPHSSVIPQVLCTYQSAGVALH